jgi:hypothetical protein
MYRVQYKNREQWRIVDGRDQTVFVGTKRQAEDWLDYQENAQPRPSNEVDSTINDNKMLPALEYILLKGGTEDGAA